MFENLKESIGEAFTDDLREELESKINKAVDSKANARVQSLVEDKIEELNESCEEYKAQLAEEAHKAVNEKINELNEMIDKYVDKVVGEFISEHEETFKVNEEELRTQATLGALRNACLAAGVKAQNITESIYVAEKIEENRGCSFNADQMKILGALSEADKEVRILKEENEKLIKMGIISEMCEDLNSHQAKRFTELAEEVEFSKDKKYINKLDSIKASVVSEKCDEEDEDEDVNESAGSDIVRDLNESIKSRSVSKSSNDMLDNFAARLRNLI